MANFDIAHKLTAGYEGGFSDDSADKGGMSYRGISRVNWPNWPGWVIVDQYKAVAYLNNGDIIPLAWKYGTQLDGLVNTFYKQNFWDVSKLDFIASQDIANEVFDCSVNMGIETAGKFLQESLNLLNRNQQDYPDLKEDGKIGSITLGVVNNHKYPDAVLKTITVLRGIRYIEICRNDPTQEVFFRGWLSRV
jgi:lysozyme family protein